METLLQDLRYAIRTLVKRPGFTAVVVITLALGIGANTAIFSVVNGVVLQPLPFKDSDRLVAVMEFNPKSFNEPIGASFPDFKDWAEHNQVFQHIAAFMGQSLALIGEDQPLRVSGQSVSADFFQMLKVEPLLGRTFQAEEEKPGKGRVVVLSHGFWQRQFGGDPGIVGRNLTLDGSSYTVVGVMPAGFRFLRDVELWTPLDVPAVLQRMRGARFLQVVARLKPETSLDQARAGMSTLAQQLENDYGQSNSGWGVSVVSLHEKVVGDVKQGLLVLLAAVGFVLLVACANVANLLLTRGAARQKEIAIRVALGAGRRRMIRHLLTESIFLSLVGGGFGLLLSLWGIDALRALSPANLPRIEEIGINLTVLGFTLIVSLLTGLLFGLAPVRQTSRVDLLEALKEGAGSSTRSRRLLRGALVVSEIAFSLILLVGTGLLGRSLLAMLSVDRGFQTENLMTMELALPQYKYRQEPQQSAFFRQLLDRVETLPGVRSAALTSVLPLSSNNSKNAFTVEGRESADTEWANLRVISPDYFRAMAIPLLNGRPFSSGDASGAPDVVIVNELMATRFWPGQDPVGKRILFGDSGPTIVGVVGNIKHSGLGAELEPEMYVPFLQQPVRSMVLVARAESAPTSLVGPLRELVQSLDKDQPVDNFRTMESVVSSSVAQPRFLTIILSVFATLALALAAVGVYGVVAFSVTQRTQEMGIRLALGAQPPDIVRLVLREGLSLALIGVATGLLGSLAITRVISGMLYQVSATDPITFTSISLLLTGVALAASFIPARRAMRVDPMVALRHE
ncbi:MAG TPA: ABC transporter permease [Blastocatellia bacterium]|nr:ABC transporter permease [Blastocatellia bacterium]